LSDFLFQISINDRRIVNGFSEGVNAELTHTSQISDDGSGVPELLDVLVERLDPTDLQSLLLEVYRLQSDPQNRERVRLCAMW